MAGKRTSIGKWYVGYGLFLILCGIAGFASNPTAAKTALISGGTFGTLSALWGVWMLKGGRIGAFLAALLTTLMLTGVFIWRASESWKAAAAGEPKTFAASLITAMCIASAISVVRLLLARSALLSDEG
ncbi:MAG: TMEM14 family protein [Opitutales bacterium]